MSGLARLLERKSSLAAPSRWLFTALGAESTKAGVSITPDGAMTASTVFACVRVLAEDVAKLPLILYRRLPGGGKERASDHRVAKLLTAPNGWQTGFEFREMLQGHLALRGNAFAYITRANGEPRELLPIHPDRVSVSQGKDWAVSYTVRDASGREEPVRPENLLHLRGLSSDGLTGLSVVSLARESIGLSLATEEHGARLFSNGAKPGGVLSHPQKLSDPAAKRLKESWNAVHGGGANAHQTAVLEEGMTWTQVGMTSEDSQFLQTRKFQAEEIARWYRMPPHKVGILERSTHSNIEHQAIEYVTDTLLPWLRRWEQAVSRALLSPVERDEYFAEFLVDGLLRGDLKSRYDSYAIARTNGWLSANEIRSLENMNPIPDGGDDYLVPLNMTPAGQPAPTEPAA